MNFFDILQNILQKNNDHLEDHPNFNQAFSTFMLIRYLSMRPSTLPYALIIQNFQRAGISNLDIYRFAFKNIPKQNPFIKYIKPTDKKPKKGSNL